eukprot:16335563-Heterocapsa_arctica.AAC.1
MELRNGRSVSWAHIMNNLDIQFPLCNASPEYHWILKEIGAYSDADIPTIASNHTSYMKTITFRLNQHANLNQA